VVKGGPGGNGHPFFPSSRLSSPRPLALVLDSIMQPSIVCLDADVSNTLLHNLHNPNELQTSLLDLPPELLGRILYFAQATDDKEPKHRLGAPDTPWDGYDTQWVEYTLVCRRLRDVALATPMLWTVIVHDNTYKSSSKWAELCAARSKNCLLSIKTSYKLIYDDDPNYPLPKSCWERAYRVAVRGGSPMNPVDLPLLRTRLPHLVQLDCRVRGKSPSPFLGGHSASLTYLELSCSRFMSVPELPALRTCIIKSNTREVDELPKVVKLLTSTPLLENLELRLGGSPTSSIPAVATLPQLSLPCLSTLFLGVDVDQLVAVTDILPTPRRTLAVYARGDGMPVNSVLAYIAAFWRSLTGDACVPGAWIDVYEHGADFGVGPREWYGLDITQPLSFHGAYSPSDRPPAAYMVERLQLIGGHSNFPVASLGEAYISHIIVHPVCDDGEAKLPPGLDERICRQAAVGHPLRTATFIKAGDDSDGLLAYARRWEADGVAESVIIEIEA
jgi:hypothetical protein